jgi:hypothetical protein
MPNERSKAREPHYPDTSPKVECQIEAKSGRIYMTARPNGVVLKQRASSEFSPQSKGKPDPHSHLGRGPRAGQDLTDAIAELERLP